MLLVEVGHLDGRRGTHGRRRFVGHSDHGRGARLGSDVLELKRRQSGRVLHHILDVGSADRALAAGAGQERLQQHPSAVSVWRVGEQLMCEAASDARFHVVRVGRRGDREDGVREGAVHSVGALPPRVHGHSIDVFSILPLEAL